MQFYLSVEHLQESVSRYHTIDMLLKKKNNSLHPHYHLYHAYSTTLKNYFISRRRAVKYRKRPIGLHQAPATQGGNLHLYSGDFVNLNTLY